MLAFQPFQHALARHLRDPHHTPRPAGLPQRATALYGELLFNNVCGFLDSCFPVSRALLGEARWRRLCRSFFRDWPSYTPWFREIPREFVRYLSEHRVAQPLPRWLADLARYEWAELAVEVMDVTPPACKPQGDFMAERVCLNPARIVLACDWPVHRIGPAYRPRRPQATWLVVLRDAQQQVRFCEINAGTARVLALLERGLTGREAMDRLVQDMAHPDPAALHRFGQALLTDLHAQGLLLGTTP